MASVDYSVITNLTVSNQIQWKTNFCKHFRNCTGKCCVRVAFLKCIFPAHTHDMDSECFTIIAFLLFCDTTFNNRRFIAIFNDYQTCCYIIWRVDSLSVYLVYQCLLSSRLKYEQYIFSYKHGLKHKNINLSCNNIRNIFLALIVLINLMILHWILAQCVSFLLSFSLSIKWIWNDINLDDWQS